MAEHIEAWAKAEYDGLRNAPLVRLLLLWCYVGDMVI